MNNAELQRLIETHEALLARSEAFVEFLRGYFERNVSELRRILNADFSPIDAKNFQAIRACNDTALMDRLHTLAEGSEIVQGAANEYNRPLMRNLAIIEKHGGRYGRLIISTLNLFDSFFWPGRRQRLQERFKGCCSQQKNLISALRRDYLGCP